MTASGRTYLGDALLVLTSEEYSPGNASWVLSLQEEALRFALGESKDLVVAANEE